MLPTAAASIFRLQVVFGCEHFFIIYAGILLLREKKKHVRDFVHIL